MTKICVFLCLLQFGFVYAQKGLSTQFPLSHEYVFVEKEPKLLNYDVVKKLIGYPIHAMKNKIEGKVYCRILVDEKGRYADHIITRRAHPILMAAVRAHISELLFIPATRNRKPVPYWVNVPFIFTRNHVQAKLWKRTPSNHLHVNEVIGGMKKSREHLQTAEEQLEEKKYLLAKNSFEKAISANPTHFSKKSETTSLLFQIYFGKAKAEMNAGLWVPAFESLTHAISIERAMPEELAVEIKNEVFQLHMFRAKAFIRKGEPMRALDDCLWVLQHGEDREIQAQAFAHRGLVQLKLGHIQAAFTDLQEALDLDPSYPEPYYFKALVLIHLEGFEVANQLLEEAIALGLSGTDLEIAESLLQRYSSNQE